MVRPSPPYVVPKSENSVEQHFTEIQDLIDREIFNIITKTISEYRTKSPKLQAMNRGVIHGDFHGNNILLADNNIVGILDDSISAEYPAAINILKKGLNTVGHTGIYAWGDTPSWAVGANLPLKGESLN